MKQEKFPRSRFGLPLKFLQSDYHWAIARMTRGQLRGFRFSVVVQTLDSFAKRERDDLFVARIELILHHIRVFVGIFVVPTKDRAGGKSLLFEEQLRRKVRFANFECNFLATLLRQFVNQFLDHLRSDTQSS